ncbi:MAG: SGNH/GDSL hydrolase family protein [Alphaproteobacteria bacterium]|nr:SGNH/GDSL hydrolase family protein [Alphaproteobacteria bacterium]
MRRPLALFAGLLLGLLAAEVGVRVSGVEARLITPLLPVQVSDLEIHVPLEDPVRLYGLKPDTSVALPSGWDWHPEPRQVTLNPQGFRGPPAGERAPGVTRILCLGGSNTFGAAVSDDETWPAQLGALLGPRVEVLNLGVSGYMGRQKVAFGREWLDGADVVLLQVYNEGRRFTLYGTPVDWRLRTAPGLYAEVLAGAPEPGEGAWGALFFGSALARVAVVGLNRRWHQDPATDPTPQLIARATALDRAAVAAFLADSPVPVLAVVPPRGAELPVPMDTIDLSALAPPPLPDAREIHPGAAVYRWYAEQIAAALRARGYVGTE